jgi:alpha-tubulin suppressor-like RCC1 family protein
MESGAVYTIGGEAKPSATRPLRAIAALASVRVMHVACGGFHSLCISEEGVLYAWGKNQKSQLGLVGAGETVLEPTRVATLEGTPIKQVAAGWEHTLAVATDGRLFTWGGGYENKPVCGHGPGGIQQTPKVVETLVGHEVVMAACGWDHSLVTTSDGALFTWGDGVSGKLGHGGLEGAAYPKRVMGITRSPTDQTQAKVTQRPSLVAV